MDLRNRIKTIKTQESGWSFQWNNSMKLSYYKTGELNGSSHAKIPLRSSPSLNFEIDVKYCSLLSILVKLHSISDPKKGHPTRVSNCRQIFEEKNIQTFDFLNRFKCKNVQNFEKLNILSINVIELNFYKDQRTLKHNSIPIETSRNKSEKLLIHWYRKIIRFLLKSKCIFR